MMIKWSIELKLLFVDYDGTYELQDDLNKDDQILHPVVYCC